MFNNNIIDNNSNNNKNDRNNNTILHLLILTTITLTTITITKKSQRVADQRGWKREIKQIEKQTNSQSCGSKNVIIEDLQMVC